MSTQLDSSEIARYGRHLVLPEVGVAGQARLREASVLVVGAGGLGSPVTLYLAAAGVGRIGLVEFDAVDLSNLQRQILYGTSDVGRPKLEAAIERLHDVNPHVKLEAHDARLSAINAAEILTGYEIVVDGSDNFQTRYLVNDACVLSGTPNVHGSVFRFEGQVSLFWPHQGPCYRCLFPEPPPAGAIPNCAEGGVLGVLPGLVGAVQATETIKWILGRGATLCGRLLLIDAMEMRFRELALRRDPECPICGDAPTIRSLADSAVSCASPAGVGPRSRTISAVELQTRLAQGATPLLLDVRTAEEWAIGRLPGALHLPVQELEQRLPEIPRNREIVVYCHHGIRAHAAAEMLQDSGYEQVLNLEGGIDAWSATVDPELPRY